jgi:hypothetical protein
MTQAWVLLIYKVPPEPSAKRVYVWRKLKSLGALLLHDSVWVLPSTERTREQMQWLASEIAEMGGEVYLWESQSIMVDQSSTLIRQFADQTEALYQGILADLSAAEPDLRDLSKRYQQAKARDYFHSALGDTVRDALIAAQGETP